MKPQVAYGVEAWDDGGLGQVAGILVSYSSSTINSLRFLYFKDGAFQFSEEHGKLRDNTEMIKLDYPTESLTMVHGSYNVWHDNLAQNVSSITFVTNKATYGPFGLQVQPKPNSTGPLFFKFRLGSQADWINGFHGTVKNGRVASIGIYLQTIAPATTTHSRAPASGHVKLES
ncbi:unnamed protein product [Cuscuta campestris]|uniref:Jacalin-type lectin domain-containing protein n=1 Tax=Cuscuta campestris TaxID=132261 RepID=A0A484KA07_9ASTE|nr:unnamed protein product [Cuscuta campestris]